MYPRQPQRASSKFRINCMTLRKLADFVWSEQAHLVEVVVFFGLDDSAKQRATLKVLSRPESHREYVHLAAFHVIDSIVCQRV